MRAGELKEALEELDTDNDEIVNLFCYKNGIKKTKLVIIELEEVKKEAKA